MDALRSAGAGSIPRDQAVGNTVPGGVSFERVRWSDAADRALRDAFGDDRDVLVAGVLDGSIELYRVNGGRLWMALRVDGRDLIVIAAAGSGLLDVCPVLRAAAISKGLTHARIWTRRPGMQRLLKDYGFEQTEVCYRMQL